MATKKRKRLFFFFFSEFTFLYIAALIPSHILGTDAINAGFTSAISLSIIFPTGFEYACAEPEPRTTYSIIRSKECHTGSTESHTSPGEIIRILLKVPLVVPTSALGLSMILLWGNEGLNIIYPSIWLIILTHIVFSVPVIVEAGVSAYRQLNVELYEGTARTLGATFYDIIETISLPMIKKSFIAGSILAFTHSLGETGATFLVMGHDITISTLVVNLVESQAIGTALFSSSLLIIIALILLGIIRKISK